jgi:hypothetical protein
VHALKDVARHPVGSNGGTTAPSFSSGGKTIERMTDRLMGHRLWRLEVPWLKPAAIGPFN